MNKILSVVEQYNKTPKIYLLKRYKLQKKLRSLIDPVHLEGASSILYTIIFKKLNMKKITEKKMPIVARLIAEHLDGNTLMFYTSFYLYHHIDSGLPTHGIDNCIVLLQKTEIVRGKSIVKYVENMSDVFEFSRLKYPNHNGKYKAVNIMNLLNNYKNGQECFNMALKLVKS